MAVRVGGVEHGVVLHVDEELRGGRVGVARARHGDGVGVVLEAVVGFKRNGRLGGLLHHVGSEAAALDHEAVDHAVEHRAVVVLVVHVGEEVLHRLGSLGRVELHHDVAQGGGQLDLGGSLGVGRCY